MLSILVYYFKNTRASCRPEKVYRLALFDVFREFYVKYLMFITWKEEKNWATGEENVCMAQKEEKNWATGEETVCMAQKEEKNWATGEKNILMAQLYQIHNELN